MWRGWTEVLILGAILLIGFAVVVGGLWQRSVTSPYSTTSPATTNAPKTVTVERTAEPVTREVTVHAAHPESEPSTAASTPVYVVESCNVNPGKTGADIHWWPRPSSSTFYECVHRVGSSPIVSAPDNPYCALSPVDGNIGCSTTPIGRGDLMN